MNRSNLSGIEATKKLLRQRYIEQRQALSSQQWQEKSKAICEHLLNSSIVQNAKTILSYMSLKQEPDLSSLHDRQEYIWGLSRCNGKQLIWHQYSGKKELVTGKYGITEPSLNCLVINVEQVDLILVPQVEEKGLGASLMNRLKKAASVII